MRPESHVRRFHLLAPPDFPPKDPALVSNRISPGKEATCLPFLALKGPYSCFVFVGSYNSPHTLPSSGIIVLMTEVGACRTEVVMVTTKLRQQPFPPGLCSLFPSPRIPHLSLFSFPLPNPALFLHSVGYPHPSSLLRMCLCLPAFLHILPASSDTSIHTLHWPLPPPMPVPIPGVSIHSGTLAHTHFPLSL